MPQERKVKKKCNPKFKENIYLLLLYNCFLSCFFFLQWSNEVREAYKYTLSQPGASRAGLNYYRSALLQADEQEWKREDKRTITLPTMVLWVGKILSRKLVTSYLKFSKYSN